MLLSTKLPRLYLWGLGRGGGESVFWNLYWLEGTCTWGYYKVQSQIQGIWIRNVTVHYHFIYENSFWSSFYCSTKSSINTVIHCKMRVNYSSMFTQIQDFSLVIHSLKCHHDHFREPLLTNRLFEMSAWIMASWCQPLCLVIQWCRRIWSV